MLQSNKIEDIKVVSEVDIVTVRRNIRNHAAKAGLRLVDQTKLITAASELVRNMFIYAKGGVVTIEKVQHDKNTGIRLTFNDEGPGIDNIEQAMQDGFTSGNSMGMGLPGAKRLVNDFEITSQIGQGTKVVVTRWK
ncbi:MAG: anti-sigma regulatory factor [bacterium]